MENKLEKLLNKAAKLEKQGTQQSELAQIYRDIAACYYKQKEKAKETEYLGKYNDLKETISNTEKQNSLLDDDLDLFLEINDFQEKFDALEKFVKKHPSFPRGYRELAYTSEDLELWSDAIEYHKKYIQKEKDINNLALACNNLGNLLSSEYFQLYDDATVFYDKAIKLKPDYAEAYYNFALHLEDCCEEYDKAKEYYEIALKIMPYNDQFYNNLAVLLTNDHFKQYDKAKEYCEMALKFNPNNAKTCNNLANLLKNDYFKQYDKAKELYEKAIELNPIFFEAYNNFANLLKNDHYKQYDKAKEYLEKAIELNPDSTEVYNNLESLLATDYFKQKDKTDE